MNQYVQSHSPPSRLKRLIAWLRVIVPLAIIAFLVAHSWNQLGNVFEQPLAWQWIVGGFCCSFAAVCLSFYRWYWLVRCLGLPFGVKDAFRLGFLGYLLNFVSVGSVGGDLFKAVFIAREHPGRRTLAVVTIVVDRLVGVYGLLLLASGLMVAVGPQLLAAQLQPIRHVTWIAAGAATAGLLLALWPGFANSPLWEWVTQWPKIGGVVGRLIEALRCYRRRLDVLMMTVAMSAFGHALSAIAFWMMACGLSPQAPTLGEHFMIVPLASVAGALPFTPAGLGTFEVAVELLYRIVPRRSTVPGVLVALIYRMITIASAAIGMLIYWWSERGRSMDTTSNVQVENNPSDLSARHPVILPHARVNVRKHDDHPNTTTAVVKARRDS